jgi:hypothetical protein
MHGTRPNNNVFLTIKEGFYYQDGNQFGNYITGYISSIQIKDKVTQDQKPYKTIDLILTYETIKYYVSLPLESLGRTFMLVAPNIDYDSLVSLNLSVKDGKYTNIWIEQHDKTVKGAWSKENPGDKPEWVQVANGYDKTAELRFLQNELSKIIFQIGSKT